MLRLTVQNDADSECPASATSKNNCLLRVVSKTTIILNFYPLITWKLKNAGLG